MRRTRLCRSWLTAAPLPADRGMRGAVCGAHGRIRAQCRDCRGTAFCEHGRRRSTCGVCGGSQVCPHGGQRLHCGLCLGAATRGAVESSRGWVERPRCPHGRSQYRCRDCSGSGICPHDQRQTVCRVCMGNGICVHGKHRYACRRCGGKLRRHTVCRHAKSMRNCRKCYECPHGRWRFDCRVCSSHRYCSHDRVRSRCGPCRKLAGAAPVTTAGGNGDVAIASREEKDASWRVSSSSWNCCWEACTT